MYAIWDLLYFSSLFASYVGKRALHVLVIKNAVHSQGAKGLFHTRMLILCTCAQLSSSRSKSQFSPVVMYCTILPSYVFFHAFCLYVPLLPAD